MSALTPTDLINIDRMVQQSVKIEVNQQIEGIEKTVIDMKENHLAHMQIAIESLATNMKWVMWAVMGSTAGVGTIIIGFILNLLTKI